MAGILIRNYPTTAATFNSDDYGDIDGATGNTRKMLLSVMATQFGLQLASDGMVFGAGSAAAPKLAVGTSGNGIYASAANTLDVTTNGTRAITVTSGQLVGIGVATPAAALHVGTSLTTSPRGVMSAQYSTGTDGARFHMRKARGTATAPTTVVTGDVLGKLVATGYDGSNYLEMASISMEATGTVAATRIPTRLVWATATNAAPSVLTDRLWLSASGNLGVGTSSETGLTGVGGLVVASTTLGTSGASGALIVGGTGAFGKKCFITDGSTGAQLRLEYTAGAVYSDIGVLSTGHLLITTTGGNRITSTVVNNSAVNARQVQGGLAFDGVTDCKVLHTAASVGTSDFTVSGTFLFPTSIPETSCAIIGLTSSTSNMNVAHGLAISVDPSAGFTVLFFGSSNVLYRKRYLASAIADYAGKLVHYAIVRSVSGASLTVYLNGVAQTMSSSDTATPPSFADTIDSTYVLQGRYTTGYYNNTTVFGAQVFNRALSASEVITLANQGVQEADKWGSLTAAYTSDFSATASPNPQNNWTALAGTVTGDIDGIGSPSTDDTLRYWADGTSANHGPRITTVNLTANKRYKVAWSYFIPSGNTNLKRVAIYGQSGATFSGSVVQTVTGTWTDVVSEGYLASTQGISFLGLTSASSVAWVGANSVTDDLLYIKNVVITPIGSILDADLSAGVGYQVPDRSSNKYHGVVSATGTSWTLAQRRGQVRATTNTSGNQQIFSQVSLPTNAIITSIVGYTTGTPTVKVGNVSAGSQLVASVAMSASTYTQFTLAATTSTTGNVWVNSSTADTINWTITYMIADP